MNRVSMQLRARSLRAGLQPRVVRAALQPRVRWAGLQPRVLWAGLRRRTGEPPRPARWAGVLDIVIAAVLAAATCYTAANPESPDPDRSLPILGAPVPPVPPLPDGGSAGDLWAAGDPPIALLLLAAACTLPLALRRRFPLIVFGSVVGLTVAFHALYDTGVSPDDTATFTFAAVLLAGYSAARYSPYRAAAWAGIIGGAVPVCALYETNVPAIAPAYVPLFVVLAIALAANAAHGWKQRWRALQADRQAATARAVEQERTRIARELHDVVTHHVSMMVIGAGAARTALDSNPDQVRDVLRSVEASGREAMTELRDVMGLLAGSADAGADDGVDAGAGAGPVASPPHLTPQPGLDQLRPLIERLRAAGIAVQLREIGEPIPLPAGAELAAYRVVQEALTNAVKHAGGASATVSVEFAARHLRVDVTDSGGAPTEAARVGGGRGLIGLRERLAVYGGSLQAGPLPGSGFRVRATIPVAGA